MISDVTKDVCSWYGGLNGQFRHALIDYIGYIYPGISIGPVPYIHPSL